MAAIAELAHAHHLPLLMDEAHGAHFGFHPDLPMPALRAGADLTVQSTHKTLSALTQAAMLHVQGNRIDRDRLSRALQLVQSTSPSYLLLASLDAARQQMATQGKSLLNSALKLAAIVQTQLAGMSELSVLQPRTTPGFFAIDPLRLTVSVAGLGMSGFEADERLHRAGVTCELPGLRHLTFILTHGNSLEDGDRLVGALAALSQIKLSQTVSIKISSPVLPIANLSPRQAFFADQRVVPVQDAIAQPSAELICPYPPGIPVLIPGEIITAEAIDFLRQILAAGGILTGCTDPTLHTLKVCCGY